MTNSSPLIYVKNHDPRESQFIWRRWALLIPVLSVLFATLLPSWNLGFVSDDYKQLVEAADLPITTSLDGMHRPLRDILFRFAYATFGLNSAPYHIVMVALHLLSVVLLYRFVLLLRGGEFAALVAAVLFGFFPRNHQSIFWLAAAPDTVVAICSLLTFSAFLQYRNTGKGLYYYLSLMSFSLALGFKETATAILPMLPLLDVYCGKRVSDFLRSKLWQDYLPFLVVISAYLLWVFSDQLFGQGGLTQNYYSFRIGASSVKIIARSILNMMLPFSSAVELKEAIKNILLPTTVLLELVTIIVASLALGRMKELLLAGGWVLVNMSLTAIALYTDRYLLMPFMGVAILVGFIAEAIVVRTQKKRLPVQLGVLALLCVYVFASVVHLLNYQRSWGEAAHEVQAIVGETRRLHPDVPDGGIFYFVNLSHSRNRGQVYVFNNGLNGALWAQGYDRSVTAQRTFSSNNPSQQKLMEQLLACQSSDVTDATRRSYILIYHDGQLVDLSSECADKIIVTSREESPELWK